MLDKEGVDPCDRDIVGDQQPGQIALEMDPLGDREDSLKGSTVRTYHRWVGNNGHIQGSTSYYAKTFTLIIYPSPLNVKGKIRKSSVITHVNVPNRGAMADLPAETIVEVPAIVNRSGIFPLAMSDLPPGAAYEVRRVADQIELTVEAALSGDRALARMALAADALVGSLELADAMLDEMLPLQAAYLPQFAGKG